LAGCAVDGSSLYKRIISVENLFFAFYEFRKGKRQKEEVPEFEYDLEKNIFQLRRELKKFTYEPLTSKVFKISEPKPRFIQAARVRDRVVHRALVRQINPVFEPAFISDSYACRIDKGTLNAVKRLEKFWIKESKNYTRKIYFLKADIRKYFDSIDHKVLIAIIKKRIFCPKTIWLIKKILKNQQASCKGIKIEQGKGLPIGNLSSQLFANIYLNELDWFVKHNLRLKFYIRYVDDFIIVSKDRAYLVSLIEPIESFLKNHLKLDLHPVKRKIFSSRSGVDFLGYFIRPYYKIIRFGNIKRFLKRINRYKKTGNWQEKKEQSLAAWRGYAGQANSYNLLRRIRLYFS
jgi:retron-type reverse transcriptase